MQLSQLSTRDITVILQGNGAHGSRPWELCSLVSQAGTIIVPPGGQIVSILSFSTFGNASMKHGVTPVPRFSEWPEISTGVCTEAVSQCEHGQHQVQFTQKGGILPKDGALQVQCDGAYSCNANWLEMGMRDG